MSNISTWFKFGGSGVSNTAGELPEIFPLDIEKRLFIEIDVMNIYSKILTDVAERTHGLKDDQESLLWDNCVQSESSDGLITLIARAMAAKADLYLVYDEALGVVTKASSNEQNDIRADYKAMGDSSVGVFISFKNYSRTDMIRLYSAFEFLAIASLNKMMNLSNAIQFKMDGLRSTVGLSDSEDVTTQAQNISKGLGKGSNALLDSKDIIETAKTDMTPVKDTINFIDQKRSFYLGVPASYLTGEQTGGIGSSGENDTKAVERGLKNYFEAIMKPVLTALFGGKYSYKSQDFRQISGSLEFLKTMETTSEEFLSFDNKQVLVNKFFDLPENAKGDEVIEPIQPLAIGQPNEPVLAPKAFKKNQ